MAENYKHLYEQANKMLTMYQDELIPGFRKQIEELEAKSKWIPVTEQLPEEHDSIFNRFYGTPRWTQGMFRALSNIVLVVIVFEDGSRAVKFANTEDGKWNIRKYYRAQEVTHWMPLPEPPEGIEDD